MGKRPPQMLTSPEAGNPVAETPAMASPWAERSVAASSVAGYVAVGPVVESTASPVADSAAVTGYANSVTSLSQSVALGMQCLSDQMLRVSTGRYYYLCDD
jgi:hypothetical protein